MKNLALIFCSFFIAGFSLAQNPVSWSFNAVKKSEKVYEVVATASVAKPWHIYSQSTPDGGPVPTKFDLKANPLISVKLPFAEKGSLKSIHDEYFGVDVKYFDNKVEFIQTITLRSPVKTNLSGTVEYMVCNDTQCLPPKKVVFDIQLQ